MALADRLRKQFNIVPSTKLKCVCVHKVGALGCQRKYFWQWILNLEPRKLNLAFWYGSMMATGFDHLRQGKSLLQVKKAMLKKSAEFLSRYVVGPGDDQEIKIQREIGLTTIEVYLELFKDEYKDFNLLGTETPFALQLKGVDVVFVGTTDAYGIENDKLKLLEDKTATRIDSQYFARLKFDKQINGYVSGIKSIVGYYPSECHYRVFRKPSIRVKQKESIPQFLARFRQDLIDRKDWYFLKQNHSFGKSSVRSTFRDIEALVFDLAVKYDCLSTEELLDPFNWPRNDYACFTYGVCPFFILCTKCPNHQLYLRFFQMREIRYKQEHDELDPKFAINTKKLVKIKLNKGKKK